jgi:hypothetical protein
MLYTVVGAIIGAVSSAMLCKITDVNFSSSGFAPSDAALYIFVGTLVGAGTGFGYGLNSMINGSHIVYRFWK